MIYEQHDPDAAFLLGGLYRKGVGVEKDLSESVRYLTIASFGGSANGMNSLGNPLLFSFILSPKIYLSLSVSNT
jgi:TPR repeat protein